MINGICASTCVAYFRFGLTRECHSYQARKLIEPGTSEPKICEHICIIPVSLSSAPRMATVRPISLFTSFTRKRTPEWLEGGGAFSCSLRLLFRCCGVPTLLHCALCAADCICTPRANISGDKRQREIQPSFEGNSNNNKPHALLSTPTTSQPTLHKDTPPHRRRIFPIYVAHCASVPDGRSR